MRWKKLAPESLSSRLAWVFIIYLLLSFLFIGANFAYFSSLTKSALDDRVANEQFRGIISNFEHDGAGNLIGLKFKSNAAWMYSISPMDLQYRITDEDGNILFSSVPQGKVLSPQAGTDFSTLKQFDISQDGKLQHVWNYPFTTGQHPAKTMYIQIAISDRMLEVSQIHFTQPFSHVAKKLLIVLFGLFVLMSGIAFFTVRKMLAPLSKISAVAAEISPQQLERRLPLKNIPSELLPLLTAFNSVLDRLEKGFNEQQDFFSTAAHELKTPLALLRGEIEMNEDLKSRDILLQDIDYIARYVNQLLNFSEVREIRNFHFETHNMASIVLDVSNYLQRHAASANVILHVTAPSPLSLELDRSAAFVLLKNMVENAIQHSPADGLVFIDLRPDSLSIIDQGNGISDEELPQLFSRFWRSPQRRSQGGAGLGLAICQEIAKAHGWQLIARNRSTGTEFKINFVTERDTSAD